MTRASNRTLSEIGRPPSERLKRLGTSAWAIAFVSFAVTGILMQAPGLPLA